MKRTSSYGVGGVLSADIAVPDHERELEFYARVLTTGTNPLWQADLTNNQGTPIIGLGARVPEYEAIPLQWMPHFQVADVTASAARTVEHGGQLLMQGACDNGQSQWAVLVDPAGAAFGVIPAVADESGEGGVSEQAGRISWLSLAVDDVPSICEFYEQVIGFSAASADREETRELLRSDGFAVCEIGPPLDDDVSSAWILHLPVDDFEQSLQRVRENGGEVISERTELTHAIVRDPVGVFFAIQR